MGLQEGRREHLLPDELSAQDLARREERHLEQQITLRRAYGRTRNLLLAAAIITLATVLIFPRRYKLSFPLTSQLAQLCMAYGYQGNMVLGFGLALLVGGIFLLLWWLSRRHERWMIVAAVFTLLDGAGCFFMLNVVNYDHRMFQESAGLDVAAGVPTLPHSVYDYMLVFFIVVAVHLLVAGYFIYGAVQGKRLRQVPPVSILERQVEKKVYHEEVDYTEHPEERTEPLRPVDPASVRLIRAKVGEMTVEVSRAFGVTALAVDGQVYNDQKGEVEPTYRLRACVNGVHLLAEHLPQDGYSLMTLYADGVAVGEKKRYL